MVQDATLPVTDFVDLVARALPTEHHPAIGTRIIKLVDLCTRQYCTSHVGAQQRTILADACEAALQATPESGKQLALVRGLTMFATTRQQLKVVADRLDGPAQQGGLTVDADLRWSLLIRLVAMGLRGSPEIDRELEQDTTAFGQHKAAEARAALGDEASKEAAWAVATAASSTTNRIVAAACRGFWQLNQLDVCRPYAERYFGELGRVWAEREVEVARLVTDTLFPKLLVEPETLALVAAHLEQKSLPHGQRRSLNDSKFDLEKALQIRMASADWPG
jgi:aminopeptidase N